MNIGDRIIKFRELKGMTRKELASILEVSPATITRYEKGDREPNIDTLTKIAKALGVSSAELVTDKETIQIMINEKVNEFNEVNPNTRVKFPKIDTLIDHIKTDDDWDYVLDNQHEFYLQKSLIGKFSSICDYLQVDLSHHTNKQILSIINSSLFKSVIEGMLNDISKDSDK